MSANNSTLTLGATFSSVRPILLGSILIEVSLEVGIAVLTDHRFLALEILTRLFKNSKNQLSEKFHTHIVHRSVPKFLCFELRILRVWLDVSSCDN